MSDVINTKGECACVVASFLHSQWRVEAPGGGEEILADDAWIEDS